MKSLALILVACFVLKAHCSTAGQPPGLLPLKLCVFPSTSQAYVFDPSSSISAENPPGFITGLSDEGRNVIVQQPSKSIPATASMSVIMRVYALILEGLSEFQQREALRDSEPSESETPPIDYSMVALVLSSMDTVKFNQMADLERASALYDLYVSKPTFEIPDHSIFDLEYDSSEPKVMVERLGSVAVRLHDFFGVWSSLFVKSSELHLRSQTYDKLVVYPVLVNRETGAFVLVVMDNRSNLIKPETPTVSVVSPMVEGPLKHLAEEAEEAARQKRVAHLRLRKPTDIETEENDKDEDEKVAAPAYESIARFLRLRMAQIMSLLAFALAWMMASGVGQCSSDGTCPI